MRRLAPGYVVSCVRAAPQLQLHRFLLDPRCRLDTLRGRRRVHILGPYWLPVLVIDNADRAVAARLVGAAIGQGGEGSGSGLVGREC